MTAWRSYKVWPKGSPQVVAQLTAETPTDAAEAFLRSDGLRGEGLYQVFDVENGDLFDVAVRSVMQPTYIVHEVTKVPPAATHVLWGGNALCAQPHLGSVPGDWPIGQRWVSLADVAKGAEGPEGPEDRCPTCWAKAPGFIAELLNLGKRSS